ncbi:MAG TPA: DinB family protein [Chitinophagaceae bacterium]|nr:DinB family protein [Chitinophagaceae bacterium]
MPRPDLTRVPEFYHNYINQVPESDLMEAFANGTAAFIDFLGKIPPDKRDHRYAPGKWTIKEVVQHITDAERVFDYRALCFARKDPTPLPGFDENIFAENAMVDKRSWDDVLEEFKSVRRSSELLFASFDKDQLEASGISNNHSNYVMGFGFITVGHSLHHMKVIQERYL